MLLLRIVLASATVGRRHHISWRCCRSPKKFFSTFVTLRLLCFFRSVILLLCALCCLGGLGASTGRITLFVPHITYSSVDTSFYVPVVCGAMRPSNCPMRLTPLMPPTLRDRNPNQVTAPTNVPTYPPPQSKAGPRNPNVPPIVMGTPTLRPQGRASGAAQATVQQWIPPQPP